jgi:methylamine dehydrogenase accessory protein MauD
LTVGLAALAAQIGVLYRRLPPSGARIGDPGPDIGEVIESFAGSDVSGREVIIPDLEKNTLLVFISNGCSTCERLGPALQSIARQERKNFKLVLVAFGGDENSSRAYAERQGLMEAPVVNSPPLAAKFHVTASPYAVLIDRSGTVLTKGLVDRREHLDSILNSAETGVPSIQAMAGARQ